MISCRFESLERISGWFCLCLRAIFLLFGFRGLFWFWGGPFLRIGRFLTLFLLLCLWGGWTSLTLPFSAPVIFWSWFNCPNLFWSCGTFRSMKFGLLFCNKPCRDSLKLLKSSSDLNRPRSRGDDFWQLETCKMVENKMTDTSNVCFHDL